MITNVDRLRQMRLGRDAYRAGKPSTSCPYKLDDLGVQAERGAAWLRGFVLTRQQAEGVTLT